MGVETLIYLAILAIAIAAAYYLSPGAPSSPEDPVQEDVKPTFSKRGTFFNYIIGRRQIGPVILWVGDRESDDVSAGSQGGSGGGGSDPPDQKVTVYSESAWHGLAVGPGRALNGIYADAEKIYSKRITPKTHPSGSEIDCGTAGTFVIYWGERDQPVNSYLADKLHPDIEIPSRWPFLFYILWKKKFLGTSQTWQQIEYDVEVWSHNTGLTATNPWINGLSQETGVSFNVDSIVNGPPGVAAIKVNKKHVTDFKQGQLCKLAGNSAPDGPYEILESVYNSGPDKTTIFMNDTILGGNGAGQVFQMKEVDGSGVNPAHALWQMLFNTFPHGLGLDSSLFDLQSLEAAGELFRDEGLAISIHGKDGQSFIGLIASVLTDCGMFISLADDKYRFVPLRKPDPDDIPVLGDDLIPPPIPEVSGNIDQKRQITRIIYEFINMNRRGKVGTINLDDDGIASVDDLKRQQRVKIDSAVHPLVASRIARRRAPEIMNQNTILKLTGNRGSRKLFPGRAFIVPSVGLVLRCHSVNPGPLTGNVEIEAFVDNYGVEPSSFQDEEKDYTPIPTAGDPDSNPKALYTEGRHLWRLPRYPALFPLRIRANSDVRGSAQYLSSDGYTFVPVGFSSAAHFGGPLIDALAANGPALMNEGPRFTPTGPDASHVLDLSSDENNWRLGRQFAILYNTENDKTEICFLKAITILSGTEIRLDGLIRGRYEDEMLDFPADSTWVFITTLDRIRYLNDVLFVPGSSIYVKDVVRTSQMQPIAEADTIVVPIPGRGVIPMNTSVPRMTGPFLGSPCYKSGNHLDLAVMYRSAAAVGTGAGAMPAGFPTGDAPLEGLLVWRLRDEFDNLVKEVSTSVPTLHVTNSDLVLWYSGEPTTLKIGVVNARAGYYSEEKSITIVRI